MAANTVLRQIFSTDTSITPALSVAANTLSVGDVIKIKMSGTFGSSYGTPKNVLTAAKYNFNMHVGANGDITDAVVFSTNNIITQSSFQTDINQYLATTGQVVTGYNYPYLPNSPTFIPTPESFNGDLLLTAITTGANANLEVSIIPQGAPTTDLFHVTTNAVLGYFILNSQVDNKLCWSHAMVPSGDFVGRGGINAGTYVPKTISSPSNVYFSSIEYVSSISSLSSLTGPSIFLAQNASSNFASDIQTLNDTLRERGAGVIELDGTKVYILTSPIIIDCGSGVSLIGNDTLIDARQMNTANTTAMTLSSRRPAQSQISGFDNDAQQYFQKRAKVEGFTLLGQGHGLGTVNGIDVNMVSEQGQRAPRPFVQNVVVMGFYKGICMRNQSYLSNFLGGATGNCDFALYFNGGINPSENSTFRDWVFFNSTSSITFDTAAETGVAQQFDVLFDTCSIDYNSTQIQQLSGYGRARFHGGNIEHNSNGVSYSVNVAVCNNTSVYTFKDCNMLFTGNVSNAFKTYFNLADGAKVDLENCYMEGILGSGITVGNSSYQTLATVAGSADIKVRNTKTYNIPTLAPITSLSANHSWLGDPGFEKTTFVDLWYISSDNGFVVNTATQNASSRVIGIRSNIATSTAQFNSGTRSLAISMDNSGAGGSNYRVINCLIPKRGDFFQGIFSYFLSAGSGTFTISCRPVKVDDWSSQWSNTNFSALTSPTWVPLISLSGSSFGNFVITPTVGAWLSRSFANGAADTNAPRLQMPYWSTHIQLAIDCSAINNPLGTLNFDDIYITEW